MNFREDLITESRRKNALDKKMTPLQLDPEKQTAIFASSEGGFYHTSLSNCSCPDFAMHGSEMLCKHILRLAMELDIIPSDGMQTDRDAAVAKYHIGVFRDFIKFESLADVIAAMRLFLRVGLESSATIPDDAFVQAMDLPSLTDCPIFKIAKNGKISIDKKYAKDAESLITTFKNRLGTEAYLHLWSDDLVNALTSSK